MDPDKLYGPVSCIIREKDPRLNIQIVRKGRSIVYKVTPRDIIDVRKEMKAWQCPPNEVRKLVSEALDAYQYRHDNPSSPRSTSTPLKAPQSSRPGTTNSRAQSALPLRSTGTQSSVNNGTTRPGDIIEKPPAPQRPSSSRSSSSTTFNSRSRSCQPTHMYMKDNLRRTARTNRPSSHIHSCSQTSAGNEYPKQPRSPRRYDGSVVNLPKFVKGNEFLTHEDLSMGQKQYIWGIAKIYSMSNLMELKQKQYQSILDHDFNHNMVYNKFNEQERLREWREYRRYTKFIKTYEQRIPRAGKQNSNSPSPCREVSHIHRHAVKGWTTNPQSDEAYRPKITPRKGYYEERESVRRLPDHGDDDDETPNDSDEYKIIIVKAPETESDNQHRSRDKEPTNEVSHDNTHALKDPDNSADEIAEQVQRSSDSDDQSNKATQDSTDHAQTSQPTSKLAELEDSNYL